MLEKQYGIDNYMRNETLEDAVTAEDFTVVIPSSFVHMGGTRRKIQMGIQSKDEVLQDGRSATQTPKIYTFKTGSSMVHFIDTPGIGDVRGITKTKKMLTIFWNSF